MQIVIDIPEDVLKRTVFYREFKDLDDCVTTIKALEKAVPLPKGHGRLIDAEELLKHQYLIDDSATLSARDVVEVYDIEDAPTIIEADSEVEK